MRNSRRNWRQHNHSSMVCGKLFLLLWRKPLRRVAIQQHRCLLCRFGQKPFVLCALLREARRRRKRRNQPNPKLILKSVLQQIRLCARRYRNWNLSSLKDMAKPVPKRLTICAERSKSRVNLLMTASRRKRAMRSLQPARWKAGKSGALTRFVKS